jgi:hypothetical protein
MRCTLFSDERGCSCRAVRGRHAPTVFERERYCRARPELCPTLRLHRRLRRRLSEQEYLTIWLPEVRGLTPL